MGEIVDWGAAGSGLREPCLSAGEVRGLEGRIPGLRYLAGFIGAGEERGLVEWVEGQPCLGGLRRRVRHYGWTYDYRARSIAPSMRLGPLPAPLAGLARRLHAAGLAPAVPDQVIVNEYLPGQGIAPHVDCVSCLGGTVITLSLLSGIVMEFTPVAVPRNCAAAKVPVWLMPRSLVILQGEARYGWRHAIAHRRSDVWQGRRYPRSRRLSITFRQVALGQGQAPQR